MTELPTIWQALNNVKSAIGPVGKQERNQTQGFNFRGIDSVINAAAPELNRHGVIVTPEVLDFNYETVEIGRNKTPMGHVTLRVGYIFHGPAGDSVSATVISEAMDSGDKACAKAMSVAYRIALLQTLNLPTDEPDPDSESFERSEGGKVTAVTKTVSRGVTYDWATAIGNTKTIDALRKVWKEAGAAGALQNEIKVGNEGLTVQEYLYRKSDELSKSKSTA